MSFNIDNLNSTHFDVLKEIGNIGAGNATSSLAKMLDKKIYMEVPQVKVVEFREIEKIIGRAEEPVTGVLLWMEGDLKGVIMIVFKENAAHKLVNMLTGMMVENLRDYDEMAYSAIKEVGNILAGSYLSAISTLTGLKILSSVPDIAVDMAGAIMSVPAIEYGKIGDSVLYIETTFTEGTMKFSGGFFMIPDFESYKILLKSLGVMD